jgi:putative endonuclease
LGYFAFAKLELGLIKTKFVPKTIETGKKGEEQALAYLKGHGYRILHVNWRFKKLEVDIIARDGEFLVVVEVKTRRNADFGEPEVFVKKEKQKKVIRAAHEYVKLFGVEEEVRFDIIAVNNETGHIEHIKRAYYPT